MSIEKNSARLVFVGKEHKDIFFQGRYHKAMYVGSQLVWEKLGGALNFETKVIGYLKSYYNPCAVKDKAILIASFVDSGMDKASFDMFSFQNGSGLGEKTWSVISDGEMLSAWNGRYFANLDPYILFYRQHADENFGEYYYTANGDKFEYHEGGAMNLINFGPVFMGTPNEGVAINNDILLIPRKSITSMSSIEVTYWCPYQTAKVKEDGSLYDFQQYAYYHDGESYAYLRFFTDPVTKITYAHKANYRYQSGTYQSIMTVTASTSDFEGRTLVDITENGKLYSSYFGVKNKRSFSAMRVYNDKIFLKQTEPDSANVVLDVHTKEFMVIDARVSVDNLYYVYDHYISIGSKVICDSIDGSNWNVKEYADLPAESYGSCYVEDDGIYVCGHMINSTDPLPYKVTYVKMVR